MRLWNVARKLTGNRYLQAVLGIIILSSVLATAYAGFHTPKDFAMAESVEIGGFRLFMTQREIEEMAGRSDPIPSAATCMGCGPEFLYTKLQIAGRYSETLDRDNPKVKRLVFSDEAYEAFGVRPGMTMEEAAGRLERQGFEQHPDEPGERYPLYYGLNNMYVRLSTSRELSPIRRTPSSDGEPGDIVGTIVLEYRVRGDENIQY